MFWVVEMIAVIVNTSFLTQETTGKNVSLGQVSDQWNFLQRYTSMNFCPDAGPPFCEMIFTASGM